VAVDDGEKQVAGELTGLAREVADAIAKLVSVSAKEVSVSLIPGEGPEWTAQSGIDHASPLPRHE